MSVALYLCRKENDSTVFWISTRTSLSVHQTTTHGQIRYVNAIPTIILLLTTRQARTACSWGGGTNDTQASNGVVIGGEWSLAINNCGKWLNGVDSTPSYETTGQGNCTRFEEWFNWDDEMKSGLNQYCQSSMDALQNWFFWTWKIGNSTELGYAPSPFWHYQLGVKEGWIPKDPREAGGYCGRVMQVGGAQVIHQSPSPWLHGFRGSELTHT